MLKADKIADLLANADMNPDPLVITPEPNLAKLRESGSASVDLHLGRWLMTLRQSRMTHIQGKPGESGGEFAKTHYVSFSDEGCADGQGQQGYALHPGSFVLGITLEWVRIPRTLGAYVVGRSSWGRRGLVIATAIGVHPCFVGSLVLELSNVGEIPILLKPGAAICQLFLHRLETGGFDVQTASAFAGRRKPVFGRIGCDEIERDLVGQS